MTNMLCLLPGLPACIHNFFQYIIIHQGTLDRSAVTALRHRQSLLINAITYRPTENSYIIPVSQRLLVHNSGRLTAATHRILD